MTHRERVINAIEFKPIDKIALECDVNAVAIYEHGEKIRELFKTIEGDFTPISDEKFTMPSPEDFDRDGNYSRSNVDEFGITWEYKIFGIQGHPVKRPLDDWSKLEEYQFPYPKALTEGDSELKALKAEYAKLKSNGFFIKRGWVGFLQQTTALRKFEDVLMDIYCQDEHLYKLTDMLFEKSKIDIENLIKSDVDCIQFGDDFGMQETMMFSPEVFRDFYKPRFKELIKPIKKAGKKVHFHSCGHIKPILEDFKEIGVDSIWPQLTAYDLKELAAMCKDLQLAIAIHPDRSGITDGTPDYVKRKMYEYAEIFRPMEGGSWLYLEVDNGFPYENIEAMVEVIKELNR